MTKLTQEQWQAVRDEWEYGPDQPSMSVASTRAGKKLGFKPPVKSSISVRMTSDARAGNIWSRSGTMAGIVQGAHKKADAMVTSDGEPVNRTQRSVQTNGEPNAHNDKKEKAHREESEDLRAEVIARHRREWQIAAILRNEALQDRKVDVKAAFDKAKLAKITTEMLKIQQDGERKAWGLEDINIDVSSLTDAQLEDLIAGKSIS
jgi:hypothetical protein